MGGKDISVREVDRQLDANAYLEKHQWWAHGRLHHQFLLQHMFLHATATGQRKYNHAICQGRWELSEEWDLGAELSTVELVSPESTREEIAEICHNVYQLWRLLGEMVCDKKTEVHIYQETLDSIKECLQHKQVSTLPGEEPRGSPGIVPRLDPQAKFQAQQCATYHRLRGMKWDSCEEVLAIARDTHWQALVAMALLEDKIERMSHSLCCGHWWSGSQRCSGSHQRRSWTADLWTKVLQAASCHEDPTCWPGGMRGGQLTNPIGPVPKTKTWSAHPSLDPHIQEFLRGEILLAGMGSGDGLPQTSMPEPSLMDHMKWIKWYMRQLDILAWWQELKEVSNQDNLQEFAKRVWASFQVPKARCHASKVDNDHSTLLAPHSLDRDWFLPLLDMQFGSQDFQLTKAEKTLAYMKALQYWVEKAQLHVPASPTS